MDDFMAVGISKTAADNRYIRQTGVIYGIQWNSETDIMVAGVVIGGIFVESDYSTFPIQEQMRRGLLKNGVFTPLHASDSTKLPDGSAATIDGSEGQVMVQIPAFYALAVTDGVWKYLLISQSAFTFKGETAYIPPAFGSDGYRYVGAFDGVAATDALDAEVISAVKDTSGYSTNPYPNPFSNRTRAQFRAQMQTGFFQFSWGLYEVVWTLFLTEYKTWNSQSALPGYTDASGWDYAYTRFAGRTVGLGNASGSVLADLTGEDSDLSGIVAADEYVANSYRGIENFFGSVWQFIDGININNTDGDCAVYVCHTPANFADDTTDGYIDTGHAPEFGDDDNYIKDMAWLGKDCTFYPAEIGGGANSSSYITDYHYNSAGGWRVLLAGGALSYGAGAGFGCLRASDASSLGASSISVRPAA
jgi:hypothetical protein